MAKHAMHVTAVFALLGLLGSLDSILGVLDGKYSLANISKGVLILKLKIPNLKKTLNGLE